MLRSSAITSAFCFILSRYRIARRRAKKAENSGPGVGVRVDRRWVGMAEPEEKKPSSQRMPAAEDVAKAMTEALSEKPPTMTPEPALAAIEPEAIVDTAPLP